MSDGAAEDLPGRILGDFEIVRPIGRGGMGVVYEARQVSLNRTVALKVLGGGFGLTPRAVARFRREAEAAARLHYTNIVPVYATGEDHGAHFYAMELIPGPSLDRVLDRLRRDRDAPTHRTGPEADADPPIPGDPPPDWVSETIDHRPAAMPHLPAPAVSEGSSLDAGGGYFDRVAAMIADVADALEHAHRNGVIHRDIKPSNLLLSPEGRLSLNDFGLARMLEEPGMTLTGEFVGTPRYMSPEQIAAGRAPLDHRTDIYSLGATLYELLTLRPPFAGSRRDEVIGQIIHKDPTPPRRLDRGIPVDLETICLKALDKDPDRRYPTAGQMAEDLRRFVNRYAISARRASPLSRAKKWVRRNPALAAALACMLVAVAAAGTFAVQANIEREQHRREQIRDLATQAFDKALDGRFDEAEADVKQAELLGASTGVVRLLNGIITFHGGDHRTALDHLNQAVTLLQSEHDEQWLFRARSLRALLNGVERQFEAYFDEMDWLLSRPDLTLDEEFYLGFAATIADPQAGAGLMEGFLAERPTDLVAQRSGVFNQLYRAVDSGRAEDIDEAIQTLETVEKLIPDSPFTVVHRASVLIRSARIALEQDRSDWAVALERAEPTLRRLAAEYPDQPWSHELRAMAFDMRSDPERALASLRDGHARLSDDLSLRVKYALALDRAGDPEQALTLLEAGAEAQPILWLDLPRALLMAEDPDRRNEAAALARSLARRRPPGLDPLFAPTVLLLLGLDEEARRMWRAYRRDGPPLPILRQQFFRTLMDYACGDLEGGEDALLAAAGPSLCNQCEAHFFIAMTKLAQGDRDTARDHFQAARDTHLTYLVDFLACDLARSFLNRMEVDPEWPSWITKSPTP